LLVTVGLSNSATPSPPSRSTGLLTIYEKQVERFTCPQPELVDQPASYITPKSRYCGSWLRYENPHTDKAALRFSRLSRNHNSFDLMQRNLRFVPLGNYKSQEIFKVGDTFSSLYLGDFEVDKLVIKS
jgi:hypothetical protein